MIAGLGGLDTHAFKLVPLDQMLRHFATGARKVRPVPAVAAHGVADPVLRRIDGGKNHQKPDNTQENHFSPCRKLSPSFST